MEIGRIDRSLTEKLSLRPRKMSGAVSDSSIAWANSRLVGRQEVGIGQVKP